MIFLNSIGREVMLFQGNCFLELDINMFKGKICWKRMYQLRR